MTRSPARRALRAAGVLAAVAFVALLAYGLTTKATDSTIDDALSRGQAVAAPGFSLAELADGRDAGPAWRKAAADGKVGLDELRGTPLVVNFWASWCDPCRAEAKVLERAYKQQDGVLFLGLDAQDAREDARDFIAQFGLTFPHVRDAGNDTQRAWGVTGPARDVLHRRRRPRRRARDRDRGRGAVARWDRGGEGRAAAGASARAGTSGRLK